MEQLLVLGIESSCDDTSIAIVANGVKIISNIISSQIDLHQKFGGVVPELAARCHLESVLPIYRLALAEASVTLDDIGLIAVTYGPGLIGSLLVGLSFAKGLALARSIPLIAVNHVEGHIYANILEHPEIQPPLICLTVSGGHTDLLLVKHWGEYQILGRTRDDAAGEAFDKIARVLGLGYPGGPYIERISKGASADIEFARFSGLAGTYDFSFSGLKTAVINYIHQQRQRGLELDIPRIAASFQRKAVNQLTDKLFQAVREYQVKTVLLSGGVAANFSLRERCQNQVETLGAKLYYPATRLCTDNAAMIAATGFFYFQKNGPSNLEITVQPDLKL